MSYQFYKLFHILGILLAFGALSGFALHAANGGTKDSNRMRAAAGMAHGIGLLIVLVAGFGLLARLDLGFSGWVWAKLLIWLLFGAGIALPYRKPEWAKALFFVWPVLGAVGAYLAINKPF